MGMELSPDVRGLIEGLVQEIVALRAENAALRAENAALKQEVADLRRRLGKDSPTAASRRRATDRPRSRA